VEVRAYEGEAVGLLDAWEGADAVVLVDAVRSGAPAGTIHRVAVGDGALPAAFGRTSSHAVGLAEAVELGRSLGRLPRTVIVYGVEAERFVAGAGLSEPVERALDGLAPRLAAELTALRGCS
jgi:hydrogenase maturation protease